MGLSEEEQFEILMQRLRKVRYAIDVPEMNRLKGLIRRGVIKITEEDKKDGRDNGEVNRPDY